MPTMGDVLCQVLSRKCKAESPWVSLIFSPAPDWTDLCHTEIQLSQSALLNPPSLTNGCHRLTEQPISSLLHFLHRDLLHGAGEGCHQSPRPAFLLRSGEIQPKVCTIIGTSSPRLMLRPLKKMFEVGN